MLKLGIELTERGLVPDLFIRMGIRRVCQNRLLEQERIYATNGNKADTKFIDQLKNSPIALHTEKANEQHYEVPPAFFEVVLGRYMKYSSAYWPEGIHSLDDAEAAMLKLTCERAGIENGMDVLELGCGWGSLTLWIAEHFPDSQILAVSNSTPQREFIESTCQNRGLNNVVIKTADINKFETERRFDRVVSVEMFEHMRNYEELLTRIEGWMKPDARLFVHIFCHDRYAYPYETSGDDDWMGQYFFTGGIMPSKELLLHFNRNVVNEQMWLMDGTHYQRTANAWLALLDANKNDVLQLFEQTYGQSEAKRWLYRWRVFFMACAELWGYARGKEWMVAHYLFRKVNEQ